MPDLYIDEKTYYDVPAVNFISPIGGIVKFVPDSSSNFTVVQLTATENKTYTAPNGRAYNPVVVNVPAQTFSTQSKSVTYTPTTSQQTDSIVADNGYDGLSSVNVTVNAMPSGSASTPATTITANPTISVSASGLITASVSKTQSVTPSVSAGYVSIGTSGTVSVSGSNTSQLSTQAAATITPSTSSQTAVASGKYTTGAVTVDPIPSQYIIPTGSVSITSNGTVDVTQYASASVNVGGGGSNWTLLGSKELTISTTNTSNTSQGDITCSGAFTKDDIIWVRIRDKAGKRAGYMYGTDTFFLNANKANDSTNTCTTKATEVIKYTTSSKWACYTGNYGVYAYSINYTGKIVIYSRYNSANTLTINGTYLVEVYSLTPPTGKTIFA